MCLYVCLSSNHLSIPDFWWEAARSHGVDHAHLCGSLHLRGSQRFPLHIFTVSWTRLTCINRLSTMWSQCCSCFLHNVWLLPRANIVHCVSVLLPLQTVLRWSQRGPPPESAGHDSCDTLHSHPCPALHSEYCSPCYTSLYYLYHIHKFSCLHWPHSVKHNKPFSFLSACPPSLCCAPVTCTPSSTTWASSTTSSTELLSPGRLFCVLNSPTCTGQSRSVHVVLWFSFVLNIFCTLLI